MDAVFTGVRAGWLVGAARLMIEQCLRVVDPDTSSPPFHLILEPFRWMEPTDVNVALVGRCPYIRRYSACGIAFQTWGRVSRSADSLLDNLAKFGHMTRDHVDELEQADFRGWIAQGVLMTNASLTTEDGMMDAHKDLWHAATQQLLSVIPRRSVALLLGPEARRLTLPCERLMLHTHPVSPSIEVFQHEDCFGSVNGELKKLGLPPIMWKEHEL